MSILEMILTLLIPWGAVLWGVNIYHQKGTWFLAGWNTMREEEKASYNEEEMCHLNITVRQSRQFGVASPGIINQKKANSF